MNIISGITPNKCPSFSQAIGNAESILTKEESNWFKKKVFLGFSLNKGWCVYELGILGRIFRYLNLTYRDTHFSHIQKRLSKLTADDLLQVNITFSNKFKRMKKIKVELEKISKQLLTSDTYQSLKLENQKNSSLENGKKIPNFKSPEKTSDSSIKAKIKLQESKIQEKKFSINENTSENSFLKKKDKSLTEDFSLSAEGSSFKKPKKKELCEAQSQFFVTDAEEELLYKDFDDQEQIDDFDSESLAPVDGAWFHDFQDKTLSLIKPKEKYELKGKNVSKRTYKCVKRLEKELTAIGKFLGNSQDSGDCFWDAFSQSLSQQQETKVTVKELRQKVSDYAQQLDKGDDHDNWIKKMMKGNWIGETYEEYLNKVSLTCEECKEKNMSSPIWGVEQRDGAILCNLFQLNLKVYAVGCIEDDIAYLDKEDNFYFISEDYPPNSKNADQKKTIEMAIYPGHFLPVFTKSP